MWLGPLANFLARNTPPCSAVIQMFSESLDHALPLRKRMLLRLHFLMCKYCERYRQQLLFIREAVRQHPEKLEGQDAPPTPTLSPEARKRIKRTLAGKEQ